MKHILVIEDDLRLNDMLSDYLRDEGYKVSSALSGLDGIKLTLVQAPDLILLDFDLPGCNGFEVLRTIREDFNGHIIMLTANSKDQTHIEGLKLGADDFIGKPVEPDVLVARIEARLRTKQAKTTGNKQAVYNFGNFKLDTVNRTLVINNEECNLNDTEFDLLEILAANSGAIVSRDTLVKDLRGLEYDGQDRSIDLTISSLRKKLDQLMPGSSRIKTVRGKGYLFRSDNWG